VIDDEEADQWFDNPFDALEAGNTYNVRDVGVIATDDKYAADPLVIPEVWGQTANINPAKDGDETVVEVSNPVPGATDSNLSRDDDVTEITGIGDSTAEELWHQNVGDLYDIGCPAIYVPSRWIDNAIVDIYSASEMDMITPGKTARAVVGLLGGVGFDGNGDIEGTAASLITDSMDIDSVEYAWVGHNHSLKDEYMPTWVSDSAVNIGAGLLPAPKIETQLSDTHIDGETQAVEIRDDGIDNGVVGVIGENGEYIDIPEKPLKTIATVVGADLSTLDDSPTTINMWADGSGEGVIHITNTSHPVSGVIDTDGVINPSEF
jgi:hypothetical protein